MLEELYRTAIHAIISVSVLFVLTRIMGKKQVAQLSFFDYAIGISIGSIAAQGTIDKDISLIECIVGLIVFTAFALLLSIISMKSYAASKFLEGTPTVIIENGRIIESGLKKNKINVNDLLEECRQKDVFDISDIEFAILETNGRLSILLKASKQPLTPNDMNLPVDYQGFSTSVIIDGKVLSDYLEMINLNTNWLDTELAKQNIERYSEVLFAYVDSTGNLIVHKKNEHPKFHL